MEYTEEQKVKYVNEFKASKMFIYEFAQKKGILVSNLRRWIKEYPNGTVKKQPEEIEKFGIINLNIEPTPDEIATAGFKFENSTIKIELKSGYDKALIRSLMGVLVR